MATTDRHFDDAKILTELSKRFGLNLPDGTEVHDLEVQYDAPVKGGIGDAEFVITFSYRVDARVADEIMGVTG